MDKKSNNKIKVLIEDDIDGNNYKKEETENENVNIKKNQKNQKAKQRKSRLIISEDEEIPNEHKKEIYEGETKILKCLESAKYFNDYLNSQRRQHSKHFLKRKLKFTYEREDKFPMFFNVPFLPKSEMFNSNQLINQQYLQQQQQMRNMQNMNKNYPPNLNYIRTIPNNNQRSNLVINNNIINNNNIQNKGLFHVNTNNININQNHNLNINQNNNNNINQMGKSTNHIL